MIDLVELVIFHTLLNIKDFQLERPKKIERLEPLAGRVPSSKTLTTNKMEPTQQIPEEDLYTCWGCDCQFDYHDRDKKGGICLMCHKCTDCGCDCDECDSKEEEEEEDEDKQEEEDVWCKKHEHRLYDREIQKCKVCVEEESSDEEEDDEEESGGAEKNLNG